MMFWKILITLKSILPFMEKDKIYSKYYDEVVLC